ncbi:uncharacterized protein HMPREF1541_07524 [Cyphellophora europaea CBS 101466]|uniref:Uncharacterized protein n=1 Tax=Cyphellophora europaea (strain CBS 101466) TaxID=1220924 RepID=W2RN38_CYPE1|nr:uncharacterized protein HMPREF1541_07524 [Cyphellophora europaea CBS 101466]ETN37901.1 hypothetical protein HMPREF1541_07524 [Cyphellophora europaea CBS 101466]
MPERNRYQNRRQDPDEDVDYESDESDLVHIQCWIPSANIDLTALATYLREYVDNTATIKPSQSPADATKAGYTISARKTLSVAECRDIIEDSRAWEKERQSREYRREPYSYSESDAWEDRRNKGATVSETKPRRRRRRSPSAATSAPSRHAGINEQRPDEREASPDTSRGCPGEAAVLSEHHEAGNQ